MTATHQVQCACIGLSIAFSSAWVDCPATADEAEIAPPAISIVLVDVAPKPMPTDRLKMLGFRVRVVEAKKFEPDRLMSNSDVILLPSCWAQDDARFEAIESRAKQFQAFVERGGGLIVCQPNHAGNCQLAILPHPITFRRGYDDKLTERKRVGEHYITKGLADGDLPFPFDQMADVDPHYNVLARQTSTRSPSLAVCQFGDGRIAVQTGNENGGPKGPKIILPAETLRRIIQWCAGRED